MFFAYLLLLVFCIMSDTDHQSISHSFASLEQLAAAIIIQSSLESVPCVDFSLFRISCLYPISYSAIFADLPACNRCNQHCNENGFLSFALNSQCLLSHLSPHKNFFSHHYRKPWGQTAHPPFVPTYMKLSDLLTSRRGVWRRKNLCSFSVLCNCLFLLVERGTRKGDIVPSTQRAPTEFIMKRDTYLFLVL